MNLSTRASRSASATPLTETVSALADTVSATWVHVSGAIKVLPRTWRGIASVRFAQLMKPQSVASGRSKRPNPVPLS